MFDNFINTSSLKWLKDIITESDKAYQNTEYTYAIFAKQSDDDAISIAHKMYYKKNGKFFEQITTGEVAKNKLPIDLLDMIMASEKEVNITKYVVDMLNLKANI